jgi:hypothetical protein
MVVCAKHECASLVAGCTTHGVIQVQIELFDRLCDGAELLIVQRERALKLVLILLDITRSILIVLVIKILIILIIPILQRSLIHIKLRQRMRYLKRVADLPSIPSLMRLMASIVPFGEIEDAPFVDK